MKARVRSTALAARWLCAGVAAALGAAASAQDTPQRVEITGLVDQAHRRRDGAAGAGAHAQGDRSHRRRQRRATAADGQRDDQLAAPDGNSSASGATTGGISAISLRGLTSTAHAGADQRPAHRALRHRLRRRLGVGRRQHDSAGRDRARRGAEGRRVGDLRLRCDRRRRQLHPAPATSRASSSTADYGDTTQGGAPASSA